MAHCSVRRRRAVCGAAVFRLISPVTAPTVSLCSVVPAVELIADSGTEALDTEPNSEAPARAPLPAEAPLPEPLKPEPGLAMFGAGGGGVIAMRDCEADPALGFAVRSNDAPVEYPVEYPLPLPP